MMPLTADIAVNADLLHHKGKFAFKAHGHIRWSTSTFNLPVTSDCTSAIHARSTIDHDFLLVSGIRHHEPNIFKFMIKVAGDRASTAHVVILDRFWQLT